MHHKNRGKYFIITLICLFSYITASAQYLGEAGFLGGVSYYNGDANSTTPFKDVHPMGGVLLRLRTSEHFLIKFDVDKGTVSGNTENFPENHYPKDAQTKFTRDYFNIGAMLEFNFFKYGMNSWDKEVMRHTPYVTAGPSIVTFDNWNGNIVSGALSFGLGYKFKVTKRLNIGVEWTLHKMFRDDFDNADYDDDLLDDPYSMGHTKLKNNDWYSDAFLFVTFDLFRRRGICRSY